MSMTRPLEAASVNPGMGIKMKLLDTRTKSVRKVQFFHSRKAPAMVSDKISLHRLHTMFSLLSLKRAYVVTAGRLVGVVAVLELTKGKVSLYPLSFL